jgi:L-methionine (R)-S-oxide reductase
MQKGTREDEHDRSHRRGGGNSPADQRRHAAPPGGPAGADQVERLKAAAYDECFRHIAAIWRDEGGASLDDIALMATINSVLSRRFSHFFWTGFYRVCGDRLVVGPYVGTVGCLQIEFGRGVCGTAAARRETLIVPDVSQFPGHIACDPNSKSEIVVPVFGPRNELIAVLDVDSDSLNAFDSDDQRGLERVVSLFAVNGLRASEESPPTPSSR